MAYIPVMALLAERGPLQQKDLVAAIGIEQPTMAALLARMERDGVVVRLPHPADRRSNRFELTTSARARLPDAGRILGDVVDRALAGIGDTDRQAMLRTLRQVAVNLDGTREDRRPPPQLPAS
jgi:DNA-binding MarR family transcriptional regulator